jgi:hypothetical protein
MSKQDEEEIIEPGYNYKEYICFSPLFKIGLMFLIRYKEFLKKINPMFVL